MRISVVAGKFDILHAGHLDSIIKATKYGDLMIVITHKDEIVAKCSSKGVCFNPLKYRCMLLRGVLADNKINGFVTVSVDDNGTVVKTLQDIRSIYTDAEITYCKGGDRTISNMLQSEIDICKELNIKIQYGVGDLLNSSSQIMRKING
jgi:cytidyltransferase-like protein